MNARSVLALLLAATQMTGCATAIGAGMGALVDETRRTRFALSRLDRVESDAAVEVSLRSGARLQGSYGGERYSADEYAQRYEAARPAGESSELPPLGDRSSRLLLVAVAMSPACAGPGSLRAPSGSPSSAPSCAADSLDAALRCYAPVLMQETAPGEAGRLDRPAPLDPDGSGALADDVDVARRGAPLEPAFYASAREDGDRLYLFYGLYYPADWSGAPERPRIDHVGDLEGALVVVSRRSRTVEAVVTQAHKHLYLWSAAEPATGAGTVSLTETGRPVLFSESGGHGVYAFGTGEWRPKGGGRYPNGPAALPPERLARIDDAEIRPLDELHRFTRGPSGGFAGLPRGARPPWLWSSPPGVARGAIVNDPAALCRRLLPRAP